MFYDSYESDRHVPHPKELRPNRYTHNEIELAQVLAEIWDNRIAIDQNDLFSLRIFAQKRVSPDPSKIMQFKFRPLIVSEDAAAE